MKRKNLFITALLLSVCLGGICQSQVPDAGDTSLVLWLKADAGVTADGSNRVTEWADQAGGDNDATRDSNFGPGYALLASGTFSNGSHDVLRFAGNAGFAIASDTDLSATELSIYAVVEQSEIHTSDTVISNYSNAINWGYGWSVQLQGDESVPYFYSSNGTQEHYNQMWDDPCGLDAGYSIVTSTISSISTAKKLYVNGVQAGSASVALGYHGTEVAAIGCLREWQQNFNGDIAEILVYDAVNTDQRVEVEDYLAAKYGITVEHDVIASGEKILWLTADAGVVEDGSGVSVWEDQAGGDNNAIRYTTADSNDYTGSATLTTATFSSIGALPVLSFDLNTGYAIQNGSDLSREDVSIFAVYERNSASGVENIICNYSNAINWGYGWCANYDSTDSPYFFTGTGSEAGYLATGRLWGDASPSGFYVTSYIMEGSTGTKKLYTNGELEGSMTQAIAVYHGTEVASVGSLGLYQQWFDGDIAEIIVYSGAGNDIRCQAEKYLGQKYGIAVEDCECGDLGYLQADFNLDCTVDFEDFADFSGDWLGCTDPNDPTCVSAL